LHSGFGNFVVLAELLLQHVFKVLNKFCCVEVFDILGNDRFWDADLRDLIPVWQVAVGHTIMTHDEERVAVRVVGHGVAAVGEGLRSVIAAWKAERAKVLKVVGIDYIATDLCYRKQLRLGW